MFLEFLQLRQGQGKLGLEGFGKIRRVLSMTNDREKFGQQDRAYRFPYHYVPHIDSRTGAAVTTRSLGWGLEYLCYTLHVLEMARGLEASSVLDVGCGDGRFLGLLGSGVDRRVGVDPSERAIRFARAFNPEAEFHQGSAVSTPRMRDAGLRAAQ